MSADPAPSRHTDAERARGLAALLAGAVCIGFAPIWVRWSEVGPVATAFGRLLLALPFMAVWAARERGTGSQASRADRTWCFAAGVLFALDLAAWHASIRLTSVANATLLGNLAPVFVSLGGWLFLRERVTPGFAAGLLLAIGGAWILTGANLGGSGSPARLHGDLLAMVTAVFYGGYQLSIARLRRGMGPGKVIFWSSATSTALLAPMAWLAGEQLLPDTSRGWLVILGLALTAQVAGQGLITYGFAHLPAGRSSVTLLLQPLVAAVAGWLILSEPLSLFQAVGGAILLAGIVLARKS